METETERKLREIYENPENSGALGGISRLFEAARSAHLNVNRDQVSKWLLSQPTYGIYHPQRIHFPRRGVEVHDLNEIWELDLAEMPADQYLNRRTRYLLVVLDVLSKFCYVEPMKDKSAPTVAKALEAVINRAGVSPQFVSSDQGTEFTNELVQNLFKTYNIRSYQMLNPETGAPGVERLIRTLKGRLFRYKNLHGGRYIDALPLIVAAYNASVHSTTGMRPKDVGAEHVELVRTRIAEGIRRRQGHNVATEFKYELGQIVRHRVPRKTFHRGFQDQWTRELFTICDRQLTQPPTYKLCSFDVEEPSENGELGGTWYEEELLPFIVKPIDPNPYVVDPNIEASDREDDTPALPERGKRSIVAPETASDIMAPMPKRRSNRLASDTSIAESDSEDGPLANVEHPSVLGQAPPSEPARYGRYAADQNIEESDSESEGEESGHASRQGKGQPSKPILKVRPLKLIRVGRSYKIKADK